MTARTLPEWIATNPDQAIPGRVKARIFSRQEGRCALTGIKLGPGTPFQFDHIIALINGGEHREDNLRAICDDAHKVKTSEDMAIKSKTYRMKAKHLGIYPKSRAKIKSRGFPKTREIT